MSEFRWHVPADSPEYVKHPAKHIEPKDQLVPLRLHGDGVPIGKGKKRTQEENVRHHFGLFAGG